MTRDARRPTIILIALVAFGLVILSLRLDARIQSFKGFFYYILDPGPRSVQWLVSRVQGSAGLLFSLVGVNEKNRELRRLMQHYLHENQKVFLLEQENARLRELLGFVQASSRALKPARLIGRDPQDWFSAVLIDQGAKEGLEKNAIIIATDGRQEGLVGRVIETGSHTSKVLLITDPLSSVAAVVGRQGDDGVVDGQNTAQLRLNYLSPEADVQVGDTVWTSGLGGVFPVGILIGSVVSVDPAPPGGFKTALLNPSLNLYRLRELLVMQEKKL